MVGRGVPLCAAQPAVRAARLGEGGGASEPLLVLPAGATQLNSEGSCPAHRGCGSGFSSQRSSGVAGARGVMEGESCWWALGAGSPSPGTDPDPCLSALLLDKLPAPGALPACRPEAERRCDVCATHLQQLTREAMHLLQAPASHEDLDAPHGGPSLTPASTTTTSRDTPGPAGPAGRQPGRAGPDRTKGLAWPPGPSVQVSVAPAGLGGALSTVTIQAQQCLEGMWSVSRVNSFLPPACLAEAAVAAVAVADTVREGPPVAGPDGLSKAWGRGGACTSALVTPTPGSVGGSAGPSAAASFFIRAVQKLSLASKRKKPHPPPPPATRGASTYPTDFSGVLQLWPPPAPPCLLRAASKTKDNPGSIGKVKVMLRIWPAQGGPAPCPFLKVDPRKKQVILYDPAAGPPGSAGPRRAATAAVPKMFAFDAVFPQDSEQAEVCSGTVADVLQSVVSGADGCIFSFGHMSLGKHPCPTLDGSCWPPPPILIMVCPEAAAACHLIDLGSCEAAPGRAGEAAGGPLCLSLSALGSVILALVNGAKHVPYRDHRLTMLLRESLATAGCRTTMIAHVSDAPAQHAETLSTVQLAARIHRLRRKKAKCASSSSGGESSCEEGRARRPPHLRPFHPRTVALDPDRMPPCLPGDPDYSSSSEQSCDTVIYVGPGGAALSDRELTDNEGPPDFVPIIPALSRHRPSKGPRDADHFRCSTFAELQERLECMDGSKGPSGGPGGTDGAQASPARGGRKPSPPEAASPRKAVGTPMAASTPRGSCGPDTHQGAPEPCKAPVWGDQREDSGTWPELLVPEKAAVGGGRRPLPSPAPPPPQLLEACRAPEEPGGGGTDGVARTPPVGMSGQLAGSPMLPGATCPRLAAGSRCPERGLLTTTVTLQRPVELNGEDELVFTVVEELSLGGLAGAGRPTSLASFDSDCSLQALASGSRPVSIISSINDEFDAYTSQAPEGGPLEGAAWAGSSHSSSISSWLSEVSVCTADSRGPTLQPRFSPDSLAGLDPGGPPALDGSLGDGSSGFLEPDRPDSPRPTWGPCPGEVAAVVPSRPGREPQDGPSRGASAAQTIHSSLPRKPRTASATTRVGCARLGQSPPGRGGLFEDPWLVMPRSAFAGRAPSPTLGSPRLPEAQVMLACAQRVVDGCEVAARAARRPEAVARIPPLRRGATTLGVTTPAVSWGDAPSEVVACSGSLKASPTSKKSLAPRGGFLPRPSGAAPPAPPTRKSSLEQRSSPASAPPHAVNPARAGAAAVLRGEEEPRPSSRADHSIPRATSSLKARASKVEAAHRLAGHASLERYEGLAHSSSKGREAPGRPLRAVPKLGVPPSSPTHGPAPACRSGATKAVGAPKPPAGGGKGRSLVAGGSRALGPSVKLSAASVSGRSPGGPVAGPRAAPRAGPSVGAKAGRGTIMGTKQALRAAHSRVHELSASGAPGRGGSSWGSADSDSGHDSGVNVGEERPPTGPALPSPYSKVTAPRRPQRYSSGHGSDNSSVLSGELPPAMGRTALFHHSGGSSGYESLRRDSEATGSASSAPDSMSESGAASPGARTRSLKSPKKRATGGCRVGVGAPLRAVGLAWGRLPPCPGQSASLRIPGPDPCQDLEGPRPEPPARPASQGLACVSTRLRLAERRQQRLREVQAKHEHLCEELAETQGRLMLEPGRWLEQFEVDPELEPESAEYLAALERATAALEQCVNLCKAHVMMVTCFDISVAASAAVPGPQEVDV
uniref:Kinesin family member 26A n=1 Tax=Nomascus leucogenys TaxID=61853 RepID=G1S2M2_NOMLE